MSIPRPTRDYKIGLLERLQSKEHCVNYLISSVNGGHEAVKMALDDVLEAHHKALLDENEALAKALEPFAKAKGTFKAQLSQFDSKEFFTAAAALAEYTKRKQEGK